jgi:hypothetical protein
MSRLSTKESPSRGIVVSLRLSISTAPAPAGTGMERVALEACPDLASTKSDR